MRTPFPIGLSLLLFVGIAAGGWGAYQARASQAPTELHVYAGYGGANVTVEEFFPATIRIVEGATVTWTLGSVREHTVTFLADATRPQPDMFQPEGQSLPRMKNPLVEYPLLPEGSWDGSSYIGSGLMDHDDAFSVTFSTAGTYAFYCLLRGHEQMTGKVEVVGPGSADLTTQTSVDQLFASESAKFQTQINEMFDARTGPSKQEMPNGSTLWFVRNGTDWRAEPDGLAGRVQLRAFLPNRLTINQGDSVVWYTDTRVPVHTVTFPVQEGLPPSRWVPRMEGGSEVSFDLLRASGAYRGDPNSMSWPRILEEAWMLQPSRPSPIYDPTKFFSSGQLGDTDPDIGRAWSLTFDTPGTFLYFCVPHVNLGQSGQVTVVPRSS